MDALDNAVQPLRKAHAPLLVAMVLYVIIGERIRPQEPKDLGLVATALVIVGIITAGGPIQHALLLYAGGFVLLILFTPRRPS